MNTTRVPFGEARAQLRELVCRAAYGGERITITRNGSPAAALVSLDDLSVLEGLAASSPAPGDRRGVVVDESIVVEASRAAVWTAFAQYRYRPTWWSEFVLDAYPGGEAMICWDERTGRVVDCTDAETITMVWDDGSQRRGPSIEVRIELSDDGAGTVVRVEQTGPGPGADYWRERLTAWRDYTEASLSSGSVQP